MISLKGKKLQLLHSIAFPNQQDLQASLNHKLTLQAPDLMLSLSTSWQKWSSRPSLWKPPRTCIPPEQ